MPQVELPQLGAHAPDGLRRRAVQMRIRLVEAEAQQARAGHADGVDAGVGQPRAPREAEKLERRAHMCQRSDAPVRDFPRAGQVKVARAAERRRPRDERSLGLARTGDERLQRAARRRHLLQQCFARAHLLVVLRDLQHRAVVDQRRPRVQQHHLLLQQLRRHACEAGADAEVRRLLLHGVREGLERALAVAPVAVLGCRRRGAALLGRRREAVIVTAKAAAPAAVGIWR